MNTPKSKPILFSTEMVRAILNGSKSQTRRIVKNASGWDHNWKLVKIKEEHIDGFNWYEMRCGSQYSQTMFKCPYEVGMVLWVRETWNMCLRSELTIDEYSLPRDDGLPKGEWVWVYKASSKDDRHPEYGKKRWKPSIFMPREACRIKLLIKSIRVERLQDISEEDAKAEGVLFSPIISYREGYEYLWESINGPGSWQANPYVWCLTFEKL